MLAFRQAFEPGDGAWLPPAELDHGPVVASWACGQNGPRAQIPVFTQASTIRVQLPTGCPPGLLPDPSGPGGPRQSRHLHLNWLSLLGPHLRDRPPTAPLLLTAESRSQLLFFLSLHLLGPNSQDSLVMPFPNSYFPYCYCTSPSLRHLQLASASFLGCWLPPLPPADCFPSAARGIFLAPSLDHATLSLKILQCSAVQ